MSLLPGVRCWQRKVQRRWISVWLFEGELGQPSSESDCDAVQLSTSSPSTWYILGCIVGTCCVILLTGSFS